MIFLVNGSSYLLYGFWIQSHSNLYLGLGKRTSERLYIRNIHARNKETCKMLWFVLGFKHFSGLGTSPIMALTVDPSFYWHNENSNSIYQDSYIYVCIFHETQWPVKFENIPCTMTRRDKRFFTQLPKVKSLGSYVVSLDTYNGCT